MLRNCSTDLDRKRGLFNGACVNHITLIYGAPARGGCSMSCVAPAVVSSLQHAFLAFDPSGIIMYAKLWARS